MEFVDEWSSRNERCCCGGGCGNAIADPDKFKLLLRNMLAGGADGVLVRTVGPRPIGCVEFDPPMTLLLLLLLLVGGGPINSSQGSSIVMFVQAIEYVRNR